MHLDFKEILEAYKAKANPTELQQALAEKRLEICNECEHRKTGIMNIQYCEQCGCIIPAKVFSYKEGACPEGKWDKVDSDEINKKVLKVLKNPSTLV